MGLVFGKITVETLKFTVLASGEDYKIREYDANIVAEVSYDPAKSKGGGFMILADYIGAIKKPQNVKGDETAEKIAMTAPVLTAEERENCMTAPVLTEERPAEAGGEAKKGPMVMQFVLPSKYTCLDDVPRPTDPRVRNAHEGSGCKELWGDQVSGVADDKLVEMKLARLKRVLQEACLGTMPVE